MGGGGERVEGRVGFGCDAFSGSVEFEVKRGVRERTFSSQPIHFFPPQMLPLVQYHHSWSLLAPPHIPLVLIALLLLLPISIRVVARSLRDHRSSMAVERRRRRLGTLQCGHGIAQERGLSSRVREPSELGLGGTRGVVVVHVTSTLVPWTSCSASTAFTAAFGHCFGEERGVGGRWGSRSGWSTGSGRRR